MEYLLKSTAILSLFYLFYKIFMQNETFFKSIRVYFLIGFISAIAIPFIIITKYIEVEPINISNVNFVNTTSVLPSQNFDWMQVVFITYLIGVVFFTLRFLVQLTSLMWFIYSHSKIKNGKYYIIKTNKNTAPFSFFNYIIYNPNQFKDLELKQIITHEKTHVNQLHSLDTILSQLILIIHWFNPFVWLYNKEIQKNLEFIADDFVQNISYEKKKYQHLLLKTISPNYQMALTNNFYNSLIKKRINMLQKNRSNSAMHFKFILIIPILITFVFTFNTRVIAQQTKMETVEIHEDINVEIITKNFTKIDLEKLKTRLESKGIQFKYSKLKHNTQNEIISINISVKSNKNSQAKISQKGTEAIKPIKIKVDNETGIVSLGNLNSLHESNLFFTSKKGNSFVFFSDDDNVKKNKYIIMAESDNDLHIESDNKNHTEVWISKNGDTTNVKKIEIIKIDKSSDKPHKIIIKNNREGDDYNVFTVKPDGMIQARHSNVNIINSDGKKPLFFVDGIEIENDKMEDIGSNNIKKVKVLKGEKAIEKYGEKAKDGVVLITTKK